MSTDIGTITAHFDTNVYGHIRGRDCVGDAEVADLFAAANDGRVTVLVSDEDVHEIADALVASR